MDADPTTSGAPLMELEESWIFGMLWPKRLRIFEDRVETSRVELLRETVEITTYDQIMEVVAGGTGASASLLVRTTKPKPILMRGVEEEAAHRAKVLIENHTNRGAKNDPKPSKNSPPADNLVQKLAELRDAGVLSPEEFEAKRKTVEKGS